MLSNSPNKRGFLLIDGFRGHFISDDLEKEIKQFKFDICKTKYLQPMDLAVNRSLKKFYGQKWEDYISSSTKTFNKSWKYQGSI